MSDVAFCSSFVRQLTKVIRTLEKEAARHAAVKEEADKLRLWKEAKIVELEDLMEKVATETCVCLMFFSNAFPFAEETNVLLS